MAQAQPVDPSSFFRLNEEIARELARLAAGGQLDRLRQLVREAGVELWVSAARPAQGLEELIGTLDPEHGWDHESVLAVRSQFVIETPAGDSREVYMPDHICPACWNEAGNAIDSCARVCGACGFRW